MAPPGAFPRPSQCLTQGAAASPQGPPRWPPPPPEAARSRSSSEPLPACRKSRGWRRTDARCRRARCRLRLPRSAQRGLRAGVPLRPPRAGSGLDSRRLRPAPSSGVSLAAGGGRCSAPGDPALPRRSPPRLGETRRANWAAGAKIARPPRSATCSGTGASASQPPPERGAGPGCPRGAPVGGGFRSTSERCLPACVNTSASRLFSARAHPTTFHSRLHARVLVSPTRAAYTRVKKKKSSVAVSGEPFRTMHTGKPESVITRVLHREQQRIPRHS